MSTSDSSASPPGALIVPDLVRLDVPVGPDKKDVIEYLADVVASAGRADTPEGLAADALAREATAPTGIPGGIAIPHCRSPHVLAPSLGFARLAGGVDFGAADGESANLVFMIAAPAGADDFHLKLLAKLARGLMKPEFTGALRSAATPQDVARIITEQVQPELLEEGAQAAGAGGADGAAERAADAGSGAGADEAPAAGTGSGGAAGAADGGGRLIVGVSSCPTGIAHTFMAAEALEQAGKARGIEVHIEGQGSGKIDWLDPDLIRRADAVVFAHDLPVKDRDRFAGKPVVDVGVKAAVNDAGSLLDRALAAVDDPSAPTVPAGSGDSSESGAAEEKEHWARRLQRSVMTGVSYMIPFVAAGGLLIALGYLFGGYDITKTAQNIVLGDRDNGILATSLWNLPDLTSKTYRARPGRLPARGLHRRGPLPAGQRGHESARPGAGRLHRLRPGRTPRHRPRLHHGAGGRGHRLGLHRRPARRHPRRLLRGLARRAECAALAAQPHAGCHHPAVHHPRGRLGHVHAAGQAAGLLHDLAHRVPDRHGQ